MDPLDAFFERVRSTNPFVANRVNAPSPADVDVDAIHQQPFERLTTLAREALAERRGLGAVLWGEAGIGKSHLLSRLARWAEQDRNACLVYLHNLQASPAHLPRSLLKAIVSILTVGRRRDLYDTPLYRLLVASIREAVEQQGVTDVTMTTAERAFNRWIERLSGSIASWAALIDRTVYDVLFRFFQSAYHRQVQRDAVAVLAVRWLAGDALDATEARQLGLPAVGPEGLAQLSDNQQIKQVLVALSRLALSRRQPFVLCFDQVDNLDTDQAAALARFLEALLDSAPNLLVVTAGIQATLFRWRQDKVIQDSAWDRLAQFEVALHRLSVADGLRIVAARLDDFLKPFAAVEPVSRRREQDPLFPLGQAWADEFFKGKITPRPRDVLNWAREGWRREQEALREQGGPVWLEHWGQARTAGETTVDIGELNEEQLLATIDKKVAQKIAEQKTQHLAKSYALPPSAEHLEELIHTLLLQAPPASEGLRLVAVEPARSRSRQGYDLLLRQRQGADGSTLRTGLVFLVTSSAGSVTARLKRLVEDGQPPERVWLITDEREEPRRTEKGTEYYDQLRGRGAPRFQHLELSLEQYAELDALRGVAGLARAGDLEIELGHGQSRPVSEQEVIASNQRQGRYQAAPLLRDLLREPATAPVSAE